MNIEQARNKKNEAKEHLNKATKCLFEAIDEGTPGNEDFSSVYINILEETLLKLIILKKAL
jgi:hypothetical protein